MHAEQIFEPRSFVIPGLGDWTRPFDLQTSSVLSALSRQENANTLNRAPWTGRTRNITYMKYSIFQNMTALEATQILNCPLSRMTVNYVFKHEWQDSLLVV